MVELHTTFNDFYVP